MLRDIAAVIAGTIRETDLAARFLGDVFAVLFHMSQGEQALPAAQSPGMPGTVQVEPV